MRLYDDFQRFIELPSALDDVLAFTIKGSFTLVILLGMDLKGDKLRRDIGIFVPTTDLTKCEMETVSARH